MKAEEKKEFLESCRTVYRKILLENIAPFWMRRGKDDEYGGIHNRIDDEGNVVGTDKFIHSQGRALWTFSALCNRVEDRSVSATGPDVPSDTMTPRQA